MTGIRRIDGNILSDRTLTAALGWARKGVAVLAVHGITDERCDCGNRKCESPGKHPIGTAFPHGHKSATIDEQKIRQVFRSHPNANLAIVPPDGVVVFDVDGPEGEKTFDRLDLPETVYARTGRGFHHYFTTDPAFRVPKTVLPSIDIKLANGYVVVPPSMHKSGKRYRFLNSGSLAGLPPNALVPRSNVIRADLSGSSLKVCEGQRDTTLTSFAGSLRHRGLSGNQIRHVLDAFNHAVCKPPIDEGAVHKIARSIGRYPSEQDDAFDTMSSVVEEDISWLLKPYLARGAITVLDGNPGQGKSTFVTALLGSVTTGVLLPFGQGLQHGECLLFSIEDDPARVLKRRLTANGADLSKIRYQKQPFTLDERGIAMARAEIERHRPVLVVIDPLVAYLDSQSDLNDAGSMTHFMTELDKIARDFNTAILIVRHLRKSESDSALHRGLGSVAIAARVRSVLVLGRHPDNPDMRAVAHAKCSWAPEGDTILFEIHNSHGTSVVGWCDTSADLTAEDLLARPPSKRGRQDTEREDAKNFLRDFLADGPKNKSIVERAAEARSISDMTLRRAADDLGIIKSKDGRHGVWSLPRASNERRSSMKHNDRRAT